MDLVEVLTTFFAEVLVGGALLCENTDASAVLPDLADVALYEEARDFLGQLDASEEVGFGILLPVLGILFEGRRPWVFLGAADAADRLVVLLQLVVGVCHFVRVDADDLVANVLLPARTTTGQDGVFEVVERFGGEGSGRGGFGRGRLVQGPRVPLATAGNARGGRSRVLRLGDGIASGS